MALPISVPFTFENSTTSNSLQALDADLAFLAATINGIGNGSVSLANASITGGNITTTINASVTSNLVTINGGAINAANTQIGGLSANSVIVTNSSGTEVTLSSGTVGNVLTSTASGWQSQASAVSANKIGQVVSNVITTSTTGTTGIPQDDTIPQNNEGDNYITISITPTNASSTLYIDVLINGSASAGNSFLVALFQNSAANAVSAINFGVTANTVASPAPLRHVMTAGTTSAITFAVRVGVISGSGGTFTLNGQLGSRILGGSIESSITITEVLP